MQETDKKMSLMKANNGAESWHTHKKKVKKKKREGWEKEYEKN